MGNLHGDDFDSVLAGQVEDVRQAGLAASLERVRTGPRLVSAHTRADLAVIAERSHHCLNVLGCIDRTQPGKDVQGVLTKPETLTLEVRRPVVVLVPAEHSI